WLVVMPAIKFFGSGLTAPLYPGTIPISQMGPDDLWRIYIRPIGAGAVAASGLITLLKTMPTIIAALRAGAKDLGKGAAAAGGGARRTDRDLDLKVALGGAALVLLMMWAMLTFMPIKDANTTWYENLAAALFVVVFGFFHRHLAHRHEQGPGGISSRRCHR